MNIWEWVEDLENELHSTGQDRLAYLMRTVPGHCCDGDHAFVDNVTAEALSLARAHGHPWLEVFFRHWHLQSQVLRRARGRDNLPEAVSLLEFANRPETRECPQSICAVQDLANCYGKVDGPGYIEERLAVAQETLGRIDPSWDCWRCISAEYITALVDAGRLEDERAARAKLREEIAPHGDPDTKMLMGEAEMELRAGDFDVAECLIEQAEAKRWSNDEKTRVEILRAELLARKGDAAKAVEALPPAADAWVDHSDFVDWTRAALAIRKAGGDVPDLAREIWAMAEHAAVAGRIRDGITLFGRFADLSLEARALLSTGEALDRIDALIPDLARDMGAAAKQAERRAALAEAAASTSDELLDRETLLAVPADGTMPDLDPLHRASEADPQDADLACAFGQALHQAGFLARARDAFRRAIASDPGLMTAWEGLGATLSALGDEDAFLREIVERDLEDLPEAARNGIDWAAAMHLRLTDPEAARDRLHGLLAREGDTPQVLGALAQIAAAAGDHGTEVDLWSRCLRIEDAPGLHWNRIVAATLAGDWATVRVSAAALDMTLPDGSGPIDVDWGTIRIRLLDDDGQPAIWYARRTGPATARIDQLAPPGEVQRYGTEIVFDPGPINRLDQEDEDGRPCDAEGQYSLLFPAVHVGKVPEMRVYEIDGVHPGQDVWSALITAFENAGFVVERQSNPDYVLEHAQGEGERPGLYVWIGVAADADPADAIAILVDHLGIGSELVWPGLSMAAGDSGAVEDQREVIERYSLAV